MKPKYFVERYQQIYPFGYACEQAEPHGWIS